MARLASLLYFRKIFVLNVEVVPKKGPLLLVCNHPSSFFEACLLAVFLPRPLYFLTRGDFFKKPLFKRFLQQTHQIPIFRAQDGFGKLRNNQDTFAYCYEALSEHKAILIFPESWTILEKRLRPLQKGAARLALGALKNVPHLNILPVGITFSNPLKFRSLVTIKCGNPIAVNSPDEGDERQVMAQITAQIETALRALSIQIDQPAREPVFDTVQMLAFNGTDISRFPVLSSSDAFPKKEIGIATQINTLSEEEEGVLSRKIIEYEQALAQHGISDRFLTCKKIWTLPGRLLLIPGVLLLILGKAIFSLPSWLIPRFLNARIHNLPFYGPIKWAMGCYAFGAWFVLCLILGYVFGGGMGLMIAMIWLMTGYVSLLHFHDIGVQGFLTPLTLSKQRRKSIQELRSSIMVSI